MEPLSIICGIAGLVNIAARTSSQVLRLIDERKDAPKQVYFLSEEINMYRQGARQLKDLCDKFQEDSLGQMRGSANVLMTQLKRAEPAWVELEEIVRLIRGPVLSKIHNVRWMRRAGWVVELQAKLREIRFSTFEILGICNVSQGVHIGSAVATYYTNTIAIYETTATSLADILLKLKQIEDVSRNHELSGQDVILAGLGGQSKPHKSAQSQSTCKPGCFCRCHTHQRGKRVRVAPFQSALGSIVLIYSGWISAGQHCDIALCHNANGSVVEAQYSLPRWSLELTILAAFKISYGLPTAGLTVQRRIPDDAHLKYQSIIGFSKLGSCAEIRSLLERRPDAVNDVIAHKCSTALEYAFLYHQIDAAKLLIAAGADPFAENDSGFPAIVYVLLYKQSRTKALQQEFENLFPLQRLCDEYDFSHLHKVVLSIRPLDLDSQLNTVSYSQLNKVDKMGYTPLQWAASQGDSSAVRLLLKAGADLKRDTDEKALQRACRTGSRTCAEALIDAGSDIHRRCPRGYQAIHFAATAMDGVELLGCLLFHGALIDDSENIWKTTPLAEAAQFNRVVNCRFLIQQGAQIDHQDWEGDAPLFEAIKSNHGTACMSLFLNAHCDYLHRNFQEQTLLHRAAMFGSAEQADVLTSTCLKGLSPHAKDIHNMTAQKYLDARVGITEDHKEAFRKLIESIETRNSVATEDSEYESDEDDVFVDALEV